MIFSSKTQSRQIFQELLKWITHHNRKVLTIFKNKALSKNSVSKQRNNIFIRNHHRLIGARMTAKSTSSDPFFSIYYIFINYVILRKSITIPNTRKFIISNPWILFLSFTEINFIAIANTSASVAISSFTRHKLKTAIDQI